MSRLPERARVDIVHGLQSDMRYRWLQAQDQARRFAPAMQPVRLRHVQQLLRKGAVRTIGGVDQSVQLDAATGPANSISDTIDAGAAD